MADIQFNCPECSQGLTIDERAAGQSVVCPYCSKTIVVPKQEPKGEPKPMPIPQFAPAPKVDEVGPVVDANDPVEAKVDNLLHTLESLHAAQSDVLKQAQVAIHENITLHRKLKAAHREREDLIERLDQAKVKFSELEAQTSQLEAQKQFAEETISRVSNSLNYAAVAAQQTSEFNRRLEELRTHADKQASGWSKVKSSLEKTMAHWKENQSRVAQGKEPAAPPKTDAPEPVAAAPKPAPAAAPFAPKAAPAEPAEAAAPPEPMPAEPTPAPAPLETAQKKTELEDPEKPDARGGTAGSDFPEPESPVAAPVKLQSSVATTAAPAAPKPPVPPKAPVPPAAVKPPVPPVPPAPPKPIEPAKPAEPPKAVAPPAPPAPPKPPAPPAPPAPPKAPEKAEAPKPPEPPPAPEKKPEETEAAKPPAPPAPPVPPKPPVAPQPPTEIAREDDQTLPGQAEAPTRPPIAPRTPPIPGEPKKPSPTATIAPPKAPPPLPKGKLPPTPPEAGKRMPPKAPEARQPGPPPIKKPGAPGMPPVRPAGPKVPPAAQTVSDTSVYQTGKVTPDRLRGLKKPPVEPMAPLRKGAPVSKVQGVPPPAKSPIIPPRGKVPKPPIPGGKKVKPRDTLAGGPAPSKGPQPRKPVRAGEMGPDGKPAPHTQVKDVMWPGTKPGVLPPPRKKKVAPSKSAGKAKRKKGGKKGGSKPDAMYRSPSRKSGKNIAVIAGVALLVIILGAVGWWAVGSKGDDSVLGSISSLFGGGSSPEIEATPEETPVNQPPEPQELALDGVGSSVTIDGVQLSLEGIRVDSSELAGTDGKPQLILDVLLKNVSDESASIFLMDTWGKSKLRDDQRRVIWPSTAGDAAATEDPESATELAPGEIRQDLITFAAPEDSAEEFVLTSDPGFWSKSEEGKFRPISPSTFSLAFKKDDIIVIE